MSRDRFAFVKELLVEVADLSDAERAAYLDDTCAGEPALRAEIDAMLAHDGETAGLGVFLTRMPASRAAATGHVDARGSAALPVPDAIGSYEIRAELGRGGMGIVYRALDSRSGREVALKVLPAEWRASSDRLARFAAEARILASLNHPNITAIYSLEEHDGVPFLTMELISGRNLAHVLSDGALPTETALPIVRQVASALEAAHARGVVHRDVKPLNVMLTEAGQVKVLDVGIAKALRGEEALAAPGSTSASTHTAHSDDPDRITPTERTRTVVGRHASSAERSALAGTPGYMSPELLAGAEAHERADVWSFGCLLYECLLGELPFQGSLTEIIRATLESEPRLDALPGRTPARLRALIDACLKKDPDARVASMRDVRRELDAIIEEVQLDGQLRAAPTTDSVIHHNLPRRLTSFVGRQRDIEDIRALLKEHRLITLTGMGGCGKTRLSLELAESVLERYPDGVWQVEFAALRDGSHVPAAVLSALGIEQGRGASVTDSIAEHLRDKRVMLVLDNCEHVRVGGDRFIAALLEELPELHIVATSREALGLHDERVYEVPALSTPARSEDVQPDATEAVQLFVERARIANPELDDSADGRRLIAGVCRRLDGIPLALELAAARLRVMSLEDLSAGLDRALGLLAGGSHATLPRHRTLSGVLDWSYERLSAIEQRVLDRLSVFRGGWGLTSCEAVVADGVEIEAWQVADAMQALIDKSLVEVVSRRESASGGPRYRLLETVREYGHEQLVQRARDEEATHRRHASRFHAIALTEKSRLGPARRAEWLNTVDTDHDNIRAAITWLAETPSTVDEATGIAVSMCTFWQVRGHWSTARSVLEELLAVEGGSRRARAAALRELASLFYHAGDDDEAQPRFEECLKIYRELGDDDRIAGVLGNLGSLAWRRRDLDTARELHEQSLAMKRKLGDAYGTAISLTNLANVIVVQSNDYRAAYDLFEESLKLHRETGDKHAIAHTLLNLGASLFRLLDFEAARPYYDEARSLLRELGDRQILGSLLNNLGLVERERGDHSSALRFHEESVDVRREIGDKSGLATSLCSFGGSVIASSGDLSIARAAFEESLDIRRRLHDASGEADALSRLGRLAVLEDDPATARQHLLASMRIAVDLNDETQVATVIDGAAFIAEAEGRSTDAVELLAATFASRRAMNAPLLPSEQADLDRRVARAEDRLGGERFAAAWAAGEALSSNDAVGPARNLLES